MAHFFLIDELDSSEIGAVVALTGPEAKHASTVSRIRVGERLTIGNGRGLVIGTEVISSTKDRVELRVTTLAQHVQLTPRLTLVQALAKTDRDERAIESATELGIDRVIPWSAARSVSKWEGPKIDKSVAKWASIVREATKQSIRPYVPEVTAPCTTTALVSTLVGQQILVLDPTGDKPLGSFIPSQSDIAIVVGPEGGLSPEELDQFRAGGAHILSMGSNILRTSTAGPAALAILNAKLGRC